MGESSTVEERPQLSVIVPAYGCVGTLRPLCARLIEVLEPLVESYEIVFVDDLGPQDQRPILLDLASTNPNVKVIRMSRNYGQQIAITAGLAECRGAFAVVMDCDLQDPPEFIPELFRAAQSGYDIVYASRRAGDPMARKLGNRLYFRLMDAVAGYKVDPGQGSFTLISRQVIDAYLSFGERERHYLFILRWLGFDSTTLVYDRHEREVGQSGYTLKSLVKHALEGFFFQSTAPLLWILWVGLASAGASIIFGLFFFVNGIFGRPPEGFTALIVMQLLIGGVVLTCLGGVGLYIARIFEAIKNRPLYLINRNPKKL
jgi:polyisoprenyl-phosphate glycosyltransferase